MPDTQGQTERQIAIRFLCDYDPCVGAYEIGGNAEEEHALVRGEIELGWVKKMDSVENLYLSPEAVVGWRC
jgi:hypothetical protein